MSLGRQMLIEWGFWHLPWRGSSDCGPIAIASGYQERSYDNGPRNERMGCKKREKLVP